MGLFRAKDIKQDALIFKNNLTDIELITLVRRGGGLYNSMNGFFYSIDDSKPIRLLTGRKEKKAFLIDGDKGVTITPEKLKSGGTPPNAYISNIDLKRSATLLEMKTNPDLNGAVIDGEIIKTGFKIKSDGRTIFLAFIAGGALFGILGLMI